MSYVGNLNGPKKSEIVERLGAAYFGINQQELEDEINWYREEEMRGEIDPVHVDENGAPYIIFRAPGTKLQRFYLEKEGYKLHGDIKTYTPEERQIWFQKRMSP